MTSPDVLFLMGDEHPVFFAGCYGHRSAKTPTMDAIARAGVAFDAAYCASPICAPSRAAMMSGRHVHKIGVWDNASPMNCDQVTMAHDFRAAGYRTVMAGKMHFVGPEQRHGFEERWTQDIYPCDFRWTRPHVPLPPVNPGQNIDRVYESGVGWTNDMDYDEEVLFRSEYGLRQMASHGEARPLFMVVSFTGPHWPYRAPEPYFNQYRDEDVDLPKIPKDWQKYDHAAIGWLRRHGKFDHLVPDEVCRRARRAILGRVTQVDAMHKRVIAANRAARPGRDCYNIYASDHGDMMGEHGLWFKNSAYEWSARVPMLISGPGITPRRYSEAVGLVDLGPTLAGLCGVEQLWPERDGRDPRAAPAAAGAGLGTDARSSRTTARVCIAACARCAADATSSTWCIPSSRSCSTCRLIPMSGRISRANLRSRVCSRACALSSSRAGTRPPATRSAGPRSGGGSLSSRRSRRISRGGGGIRRQCRRHRDCEERRSCSMPSRRAHDFECDVALEGRELDHQLASRMEHAPARAQQAGIRIPAFHAQHPRRDAGSEVDAGALMRGIRGRAASPGTIDNVDQRPSSADPGGGKQQNVVGCGGAQHLGVAVGPRRSSPAMKRRMAPKACHWLFWSTHSDHHSMGEAARPLVKATQGAHAISTWRSAADAAAIGEPPYSVTRTGLPRRASPNVASFMLSYRRSGRLASPRRCR